MSQSNTLHPYAVYHAINVLAMCFPDPQGWQKDRDQHYRHVANVYAPRDQVFTLTNHHEGQDWTKRPEVFWVAPDISPRSTSVGDVIYSPSTSRAWLVMSDRLQEMLPQTFEGSMP